MPHRPSPALVGISIAILSIATACSDAPSSAPAPVAQAAAPEWTVMVGDARVGPIAEGLARAAAAEGVFAPSSAAWSPSLTDWTTLSEALPDLEFGGRIEDGDAWIDVFRRAGRITEPTPRPPAIELASSERRRYLERPESRRVLDAVGDLVDRYGPVTPDRSWNMVAEARKVARLIIHDLRAAAAAGDRPRAERDLAALCSLAKQMSLMPVDSSFEPGEVTYRDFRSSSHLVAAATIASAANAVVMLEDPTLASLLDEAARRHLDWSTPEIRSSIAEFTRSGSEGSRRASEWVGN